MASQHTIFRGGWELKNLHSFFDYWFGTFKSTIISGKMLMGWREKLNGDTPVGGHCPVLCDINGHDWPKAQSFKKHLLRGRIM